MNKNTILALSFLVPLAACGDKPKPPVPSPRVVLAYQVRVGGGAAQAEYSGEVKPRHEAALGFRVAGKLIERRVEVGDSVAAGQVLARLDPADLAQSLKGAQAQLAAAEAERTFARAELERYRGLRAQQFVSQAALDGKETALKSAEEKFRAAAAQRAIAANQAAYAALVSDSAGVVSAVLAEPGQVLAAGQPVIKVARSGEKEVAIALPENRVAAATHARAVEISLWAAPDKRYRGRVREVAPQADPVTRTFAVRVSLLDADDDVRLGMTARVSLADAGGSAPMLIPAGSVFQQGKQAAVWVIATDGRVHLRPVQVSAWREDGAAIQGGLAEGERIVAAGAYKLVEGEKVQVADTRP